MRLVASWNPSRLTLGAWGTSGLRLLGTSGRFDVWCFGLLPSDGKKSLSVETSISHAVAIKEGDDLIATTEELSFSDKIGVYNVSITNNENEKVAFFKGTVYRTSKDWFLENE